MARARTAAGAAVLALLALGCERLGPGEVGQPSLVLRDWKVVSERSVGLTLVEYEVSARCANAGPDALGVAALVLSTSPDTTVVEDQIRCGPVASQSAVATLDTITLRQERSHPFDPNVLTGVALVWGPADKEDEQRVDRTHFQYTYYAELENQLATPADVVATLTSTSAATAVVDDTVSELQIPSMLRRASTDRFVFRHDRTQPFDPKALVWTLRLGSARASFAVGEVYDDATGRPLAGAHVRALVDPAPETTTDERGAWRLALPAGPGALALSHDGYTPAWRSVVVPAGGIATALDARLAPQADAKALLRREGGAVLAGDGSVRLDVEVGALAGDGSVRVTRMGPQALPAPLPLGWSPLAAFEVEAAGFAQPTSLALLDPTLAAAPMAARFDETTRSWLRTAIAAGDAGPQISLAAPGIVALARPDVTPAPPPVPDVDAPLVGVTGVELPADAAADLSPSPRVIFVEPGARADVAAQLRTSVALPSGTPIEVGLRERYTRTDETSFEPLPFSQDLLLFADATGPTARFAVTPVPGLDAALLREGVIDLAVHAPARPPGAVVGAGGGRIESGGAALDLAPGALAADAPVFLTSLDATALGIAADPSFEVLGGVDLDLGGVPLASAATLAFPAPADLAADDLVLLVQAIVANGRSELELVGVATQEGVTLHVAPGTLGLPLAGITGGGRFALVRLVAPAGFATGAVTRDGVPVAGALVRSDTLPFVGRSRDGDARFAVAGTLGPLALTGLDLVSGDQGNANTSLADRNAITTQDLVLATSAPAVLALDPHDGATGVAADAHLTARLSHPLDPASVGADAFRVAANNGSVAGQVGLSGDGATLAFAPAAPLASDTEYQVVLAASLHDRFGRALAGNQPDGSFAASFRTADTTPPPRPEAGQLQTHYDVRDHLTIAGTQGAAEPGSLVVATNQQTGISVSVLAGADGSFSLGIDATTGAPVLLVYRDAAGNQTEVPFERPVVVTQLDVTPANAVFLEIGRTRSLAIEAHFSDGSSRALALADVALENTDPAAVAVDADGTIRSLADGTAELRVAFGDEPYREQATARVQVMTHGDVLAEQTIGAEGGDVELDNGFALRIPAGALPGDVPIRIEEFPLEAPLQIDRDGTPVRVLALYRLSPDVHFERPIALELPYTEPSSGPLPPEDDLVAMSTTSPDLGGLVADGIEGSDDERPQQYLDRLNRVVRVLTNHFSIRVLMQVEDGKIAGSTDAHFDFEGVTVNYLEFPGHRQAPFTPPPPHFDSKPPAGDQFIVHHATNPGVRVNARVTFPPGSAGQNVTIRVSNNIPGDNPFFMEGCDANGNNCDTIIHRHISTQLTIDFVALTGHDAITLRFTRGANVDDVDVQPSARVTVQTPIAIPNNQAQMTTLINSSGQNGQVVGSQTLAVTAHFFVNSKGLIYRLYPRTLEVQHAGSVNNFSTGIEIQQTTSPRDFYSGPQIDALVALTDFLINEPGQHILVGERARWRRPDQLATVLPNTDRSHAPIGDFEPFITHREESRDYEGNPHENPGACDSGFRKNDPCGESYDIQAIVGALAYDFPGLIDTRGGDLLQSKPALAPGRGGAVALEYGLRPDDQPTDPMHINQFAGIPGTAAASDRRGENVDQVVIAAGDTSPPQGSNDKIANLIVRGTLQLSGDEDDITLRVSGTLYVAPGGRILGAGTKDHPNGRNLTILAAGPVVLHGLVDLTGFSTNDTQPGHGGRLTVHSRAVSPLLVPTIVTQGGDVMTYDEGVDEDPELFGEGGKGGDVTILGAPKGSIVLSGMKTPRTPPIQCDPLGGPPVLPGLRFPINTIPFDRGVVSDTVPYTSHFQEEPAANAAPCPHVAEFNPQIGLTRTQGRGIVTSGGMGASVRVRIRATDTILRGSPGGAGGDIRIGFPEDAGGVVQAGTIRFRGVSLITGGGTGLVDTTIPLVTLVDAAPNETTPMVQLTGGAGGRGSTGILRSFVSEILAGGVPRDVYFAPEGGDGGSGGAAGAIFIEPTAKIFPSPVQMCTKLHEFRGHDGGIPKEKPNRVVGVLQTLCARVGNNDLELLTLPLAKSAEDVNGNQCGGGFEGPDGQCELLVLGGSGGVAGGSVSNAAPPPPLSFNEDGTAGHFGPAGAGGVLTLPSSITSAVKPF